MIWTLIISGVLKLLTVLISIFPDTNPDTMSAITSGVAPVRTLLHTVSFIVPVNALLYAFSIIFATELLMLGIKATVYIIHTISLKFIPKL